jgi:hypothetical protein
MRSVIARELVRSLGLLAWKEVGYSLGAPTRYTVQLSAENEALRRENWELHQLLRVAWHAREAAERRAGEALHQLYDTPEGVLGVLPGSSLELAEAAYKVHARRQHPDAGGSNEQMKRLNWAIAQIRARHGR